MTTKEKIYTAIALIAGIIMIIMLLVPNFKMTKLRNKTYQETINSFISNSQEIFLDSIQIVKEKRNIVYADTKYPKKKNILLLKDDNTNLYYQIEIYDGLLLGSSDIKSHIYLIVNLSENKDKGAKDNPIISLRFYLKKQSTDYYVDDKEYLKNVTEYLTYRNYTPMSKVYTTIALMMIPIMIVCMVLSTRKKKEK